MFVEKELHAGQVVSNVRRRHQLFFLFDPTSFLCQIAFELPHAPRFKKLPMPLLKELLQFFEGCQKVLRSVLHNFRIARLIAVLYREVWMVLIRVLNNNKTIYFDYLWGLHL